MLTIYNPFRLDNNAYKAHIRKLQFTTLTWDDQSVIISET